MKFLVFNMVVAAALFYLFAGETTDFRQLVKKADTNITKLKNGITELVPDESSDAPVQETVEKAPRQTEAPVVGAKTQKLPAAKMVKRSPEQKSQEQPVPGIKNPPTVQVKTPDNDVLKRREEVLSTNAAKPASRENIDFMAPKTRKRELLFLAEEMEILAAKLANE